MYTRLQIGGPADFFAEPDNEEELTALLKEAEKQNIPIHILGSGASLLVPEEGVSGLVISLNKPAFCRITAEGEYATGGYIAAGGGVPLGQVVTYAVSQGFGGIEDFVGMPGSFGGAVRCNLGTSHSGGIGQWIESVRIADFKGHISVLSKNEITFGYRYSSLENAVLVSAVLQLEKEGVKELSRRMRKIWIIRKSQQPVGESVSVFAFKDTESGQSASELIERVGLRGTKIGGAEISERNPGFITVSADCISNDVLRLIRLVQEEVARLTETELEPALEIW
jgi:UDP-N-acetylmuramate dehydrogenase